MSTPPEPLDPEYCPECGGSIPPEAEVCPACGLRLYDRGPEDTLGEHFRQGEDQPRWDPIEALDDQGRLRQQRVPEFENLVTVFRGTMAEAVALRASLGAQGFETYIRDESTKVIDPFITGGYAFGVTLDAPAGDAEAIQRILAEERSEPPAHTPTPEEELNQKLERLTRSIILAVLLFPPIGLVLVARYAWLGRLYQGKPPGLNTVIVFGLIGSMLTYFFAISVWFMVAHP